MDGLNEDLWKEFFVEKLVCKLFKTTISNEINK